MSPPAPRPRSPIPDAEGWLVLLLRVGGVLTGSALFAVFLPVELMASIHRALGLGAFPAAPVTDYLSRSLSAMYALHGLVLLGLSTDVRRHLPVVRLLAWGTVALGALLLGIDLHAGLPAWWVVAEGPPVIAIGLAMAGLSSRVAGSDAGG